MADTLTRPTGADVVAFVVAVQPPAKRADAQVLAALFARVTGARPAMWSATIIGYGQYHYRYASGHEGDMCRAGFSPRRARHCFSIMACGDEREEAAFAPLLARLGKHARGKACLYANKLANIDVAVLVGMGAPGGQWSFERYPDQANPPAIPRQVA